MGNPRFYFWAFGLLVLLSCDDQLGEIGVKNPNRTFEVVAKEFIIPTKVFLMDSVSTSTGVIENTNARGKVTMPEPQSVFVGNLVDPIFGSTSAVAYTPYQVASYPYVNTGAVYDRLDLTLIFDYYWAGGEDPSTQTFQVYELTDSIMTYLKHFSHEGKSYGKLLGETTHTIDPNAFDENYAANTDTDATNNILDSLNFRMDDDLGRQLFEMSQDTIGDGYVNLQIFRKLRRLHKGFAFVSPNSNKIVGLALEHVKSRMTLSYHVDTVQYKLDFRFTPPGQAVGTSEYMGYTQYTTDRSGTPLASLSSKYEDFEPADGMRYIQAGEGIATKLDFSEVFAYFKDLPNVALSVAELRIESDEQRQSPASFKLRVLKPNNREQSSATVYYDLANDPYNNYDATFVGKHGFVPATFQLPFLKCDIVGDDNNEFRLIKNSDDKKLYVGYLTNFLQQELSLDEADQLKYYALLPQVPDLARGINGFYFPADKIKLTVYYTSPKASN